MYRVLSAGHSSPETDGPETRTASQGASAEVLEGQGVPQTWPLASVCCRPTEDLRVEDPSRHLQKCCRHR